MNVIGQGTYGCVHRKPIKCDNKQLNIDYKNKISKLMTTKHADAEMREYALIERADPDHKFHMELPVECNPERGAAALSAIDKCDDFDRKDIEKYKLLIMPDGGVNLNDYAKQNVSKNMIEIFWIEAQRIFYGLKVMSVARIVHHDFKPHNIVFNTKTKRMNYIDFGFMDKTDDIINNCKQSKCRDGVAHWSFPYEFRFINKGDYFFARETGIVPPIYNDEQFDTFLEYVTKPGDSREKFRSAFTHSIDDMFKHDLKRETYDQFVKKSMETTDVYSVGLSFLYVLNHFDSKMDPKLVSNLRDLFHHMVIPRVSLRLSATDALTRYEAILASSGLMAKHKRHFEVAKNQTAPLQN
jgi:serine/threonine protein kinase